MIYELYNHNVLIQNSVDKINLIPTFFINQIVKTKKINSKIFETQITHIAVKNSLMVTLYCIVGAKNVAIQDNN